MKENEMDEFSWSGLFMVTCVCSFAFTGVIKVLDGSTSPLFQTTGIVTLLLWMLNAFARGMGKMMARKKENNRYAS